MTPKGTRPAAFEPPPSGSAHEEPELVADVRRALNDGHPLGLLALASSLLAVVDPREKNPFEREPSGALSREQMLEAFIEIDQPESSALLAAIAALDADDVERRRIERALETRSGPLPSWLDEIGLATPEGCVEMLDVLGDGDDIMVGMRWPSGAAMCAVVYIDHNLGSLVKDGFVLPEPLETVVALGREHSDDPDTAFNDLNPADAKAKIAEGIALGARTIPPLKSDTWPACRPLIEWMIGLLPAGGTGYVRPEWSAADQQTLKQAFFASPFAAGLDHKDHHGLVDNLVWFGSDYGPGDPMRWSPVSVELVLVDWIPRKILGDASYLAKAPDVLRAFIRFCHAERTVRPDLTTETLEAVDRWEPAYQKRIRSPRAQGPAAIVASVGAIDPEPLWDDDWEEDWDVPSMLLEGLRRQVGGADALADLDDDPLPDEPFDWTGIPTDRGPRVREALEICDRICTEILDTEYRTAVRRLLASIARRGGHVLGRGRADTAAAAICWSIGQANGLFRYGPNGMTQKDFFARCGVKQGSIPKRAEALLEAAGFPVDIALGSPRYLISAQRRRVIDSRERWTV